MAKSTIIKSLLSGSVTNDWSSKRAIAVVCVLSLVTMMILCPVLDLKAPPEPLVSAVEMIGIVCIGGTAVELFANYRKNINRSIAETTIKNTLEETEVVNQKPEENES